MAEDYEYGDEIDYYNDIQERIPGIGITNGYRTPEYVEDMRKRGYKPASKGGHLEGSKLDFVPPPGKDMQWLKTRIKEVYPFAEINPNEHDHADVHFPGYTKAPAVGNARTFGVLNPNRWEYGEPLESAEQPAEAKPTESESEWSYGEVDPVHQGGNAERNLTPEEQTMVDDVTTLRANGADVRQIMEKYPVLKNAPENEQNLQYYLDNPDEPMENWIARPTPEKEYETSFLGFLNDIKEGIGEGVINTSMAIPSWVAKVTQGHFGLLTEEEVAAAREEFDKRVSDNYENPEGWGRTIGEIGGEGLSLAPLNRIKIFEGAAAPVLDLAAQGGAAGAIVSGGDDVAKTAAAGALLAAGLGGPIEGVARSIKPKSFDPVAAPDPEVKISDLIDGEVGKTAKTAGEWKDAVRLEDDAVQSLLRSRMKPKREDIIAQTAEEIGIPPERVPVAMKERDFIASVNENLAKNGLEQIDAVPARVRIEEQVKNTTEGWKNKPDIKVVNTIDDLPDDIRAAVEGDEAADALGLIDNKGRVHIIAENISDPADVPAVVFHEALGHKGLTNLFRDRLDDELEQLYQKNPKLQEEVDNWNNDNKDLYADTDRPLARAVDEVLAIRSENGQIDVSTFDRVKQIVKQFARRAGLDLSVSDAEVTRILGMAHDTVINGDEVTNSGIRYMRRRKDGMLNQQDVKRAEAKAEENQTRSGMAGSVNLDRISTGRADAKPLTAEIAKTFPKKTLTHDELKAEARKHNISVEEVSDFRRTLEGAEVRALQTRNAHAKAASRRARLYNRIQEGDRSPERMEQYAQALTMEHALLEDASAIASTAGRLLNQYQVMATGTAATDGMRFMMSRMDNYMERVRSNAFLGPEEKVDAQIGLAKLAEGRKLNTEDIKNLRKVFSNKMVKEMIDPRTRKQKFSDDFANAANLPRALLSSYDLSAPLRQGILLINRKEYWKAYAKMFHYMGSEKAFKALSDDIRSRPTFRQMEQTGLELSDIGKKLSTREEDFMSEWAEKIPVIGKGVRASERAYTGFLNKLRADTFDTLVKQSKDAGIDFYDDPKALKDIASFVNNATGRGNLGKLNAAAPVLNSLFFSPRLIASRVTLLNPGYYYSLSPIVRKEAIKSLLSFGALAATVSSLFAAGGAKVNPDPRSTDFGKIRYGNTRYDIFGGFQQYLVLGARMWTNEKLTAKDKLVELGKKFGSDTRRDLLLNFFVNKLSPIASYVSDFLEGKNAVGEEFEPVADAAERFVPMFLNDVKEVIEEEGLENVGMALPGVFGVSLSTYDENKPKEKETTKWEYGS